MKNGNGIKLRWLGLGVVLLGMLIGAVVKITEAQETADHNTGVIVEEKARQEKLWDRQIDFNDDTRKYQTVQELRTRMILHKLGADNREIPE